MKETINYESLLLKNDSVELLMQNNMVTYNLCHDLSLKNIYSILNKITTICKYILSYVMPSKMKANMEYVMICYNTSV